MCGLSGIFSREKSEDTLRVQIKKMAKSLEHRGPDDLSVYINNNIAIGHNRLSIIDTSKAGNQPFFNNSYALAYNGEIYNYLRLKKRLASNTKFKSTSDTEVLFHMLNTYGVDKTLKQIKGMFAFSYYDSINNDIYLCRDRLGIKPLFWCYKNGTLYWSSEIKSIKSVVPISIDHMRTLHSLAISADESRTRILFSDVNILSPGTYLKCKLGGKPEIKIYYDLINDIDKDMYNELNRLPEDQIKICLTEKFKSSVESMLMSDVPLGTFVSGGIDSSIIASIGNETNDMNLFTSDVADENSELQYAKYLSNHLGKKLFVSKYTPDHWIEDMINCTYHYETPITTHINALPFSRVAELSNQHGVKPVLTGEGADELFIGYPYVILDRFKNILLLPINIMTSFYNIIPRLKKHLIPDSDVIPRFLIEELLIRNERKVLREKLIDAYSFVNKKNMDWTVKTGEDLSFHLHTLLHRNDRMGMMYSIESRFPFLDEEIIKFGLNLPVKWKIKYSLSHFDKYHPFIKDKYIIRQIASDVLPNKIANRPKRGFPISLMVRIDIKEGFFNDGYINWLLKLSKAEARLLLNMSQHYRTKLLLIEIFGRIFHFDEDFSTIKSHLSKHLIFTQ